MCYEPCSTGSLQFVTQQIAKSCDSGQFFVSWGIDDSCYTCPTGTTRAEVVNFQVQCTGASADTKQAVKGTEAMHTPVWALVMLATLSVAAF